MPVVRQDSKQLRNFLGKWNRETETAEQNGWAIHSQIQKVTCLEITSRFHLYFSSRPRKETLSGGRYQNQLQLLKTPVLLLTNQWRPWPWKGTPGELINILLKLSPEIFPKTPTCKRERKASRQRTQLVGSPSGEQPEQFPFPSFPPLLSSQAGVS